MTTTLQAGETLLSQYFCSLIDIINEKVYMVEPLPVLIQEIPVDRFPLDGLAQFQLYPTDISNGYPVPAPD